ncbi:VPS9 domain-containing protein [Entamoeba marina]
MLNDVLSHVKTGTIINNIGYYCQSPTELVGTVTTIDLIQHHLQELNDNKEQSCEEYKTALQELQNQDRKEVLITLLKDITVLDKDSFQEIPHNETTQTHFNQFIFDLNHSIGINLYTFLSNTSDNLCESIPPLIHSISKELIDTYELDFPFIYQILYVLLQRSIFPRLYSSLKTIHTNELSILDSSFKELQQQIQINPTLLQFTHIDKIQSNPKLIQLAHSTHFNQQYVPYDFLLYLNELITDITSNYDDIITGENLMCVVVWVLVNSSINDVNLLNAYLKQYTPKWMLKGKLSYCTTTYEASIQLILQNIQVQE